MNILIVESDRLIRDQVKVGLQQFPEFRIDWGEGYPAINRLRLNAYNYVFLGVPSLDRDGLRLLEHLRSFDQVTDVIVVAGQRTCRDLAPNKAQYGIHAFLGTPLSEVDFFRLIARLRSRHLESAERGPQS